MGRKKIALVGVAGFQRRTTELHVDCFPWNRIANLTNFRDYDIVIFMLTTLNRDEELDGRFFLNEMDPHRTHEMLRNNGVIIIIGDPRIHLRLRTNDYRLDSQPFPFLSWTGIQFIWDDAKGDTVAFEPRAWNRQYTAYISHIRQWSYSLRACVADPALTPDVIQVGSELAAASQWVAHIDSICTSRYSTHIAFAIYYHLIPGVPPSWRGVVETRTPVLILGPIIFLPPCDLSVDDTVVLILRDLCGVETGVPEPEWIKQIEVPGQARVDQDIEAIRLQIVEMIGALESKEQERVHIRSTLHLLYSLGDQLEDAVRDVLRKLGAEVRDPNERGKEDGWIAVQVDGSLMQGVLEVKGTRNRQLGEDGLRQLQDWKTRGIMYYKTKYKGIFIGASQVSESLEQREYPFSDSRTKNAEMFEISALRAEDLYAAYSLHLQGQLDCDRFWKVLFRTNGVVNIERLR